MLWKFTGSGGCTKLIYLDNAATSWPKPDSVWQAMEYCLKEAGANPGRGGHEMALQAGRIIYSARENVARLFKISNPLQVVFTLNATESLNLAIKGLLCPGDHVITSSIEHNSVLRPLQHLSKRGVEVTVVAAPIGGTFVPDLIRREIRKNTKCVILNHASNVFGNVLPVAEVGSICREKGILFMVDAAQTAGFISIDVDEMGVDLLAFPGHKGLYGPQGTGGLYLREGIDLVPLKEGGTGSNSESLLQPEIMPDRYESGTPNTVGIAGLGAGVAFVLDRGLEAIAHHELALTSRLIEGLKTIDGLQIYGPAPEQPRVPVVSFNVKDKGSSDIGFLLDRIYGIACRTGLHCAPEVHHAAGTFEQGTVRASISYFNSREDIERLVNAVQEIAREV